MFVDQHNQQQNQAKGSDNQQQFVLQSWVVGVYNYYCFLFDTPFGASTAKWKLQVIADVIDHLHLVVFALLQQDKFLSRRWLGTCLIENVACCEW